MYSIARSAKDELGSEATPAGTTFADPATRIFELTEPLNLEMTALSSAVSSLVSFDRATPA